MEWELLNALKLSVLFEKEGVETYLQCAMRTDSIQGKDMYINLARDEHSHVQKLHKKLSEAVMESLKKGAINAENMERVFSVEVPIEGEAKRWTEIPEDECAIIEMAIDNEVEAQKFYTQQAEKSEDPAIKTLYMNLTMEEENHEKLLRAELGSIKGDGHWFDFREFTLEAPG